MKKVLTRLKELKELNRAKITLRPIKLDKAMVVTLMDASFAQEEGRKSQMGFFNVLTEWGITMQDTPCSIIEFESKTISRVVRSTMAAESASLSVAVDRQLYLRLLVDDLNRSARPDEGMEDVSKISRYPGHRCKESV